MKKQQKTQPETEEILINPKNEVPPYPDRNATPSSDEGPKFTAAEEKKVEVAVDIEKLSYDLVDMGFKMWHLINPRVREIEEKECLNIAKPFAAVIEKHDLTKYFKYMGYTQEILLVYNLGSAIVVRTKELKKPIDTTNPFKDNEEENA